MQASARGRGLILAALLLLPLVPLLWACSGEDAAKRNTGPRQIFVPETAQASADKKAEQEYRYDPTGKPDPFKSFLKQMLVVMDTESLSPLERFDLSQLTVTGIIWATTDPRALVEIEATAVIA